MKRLTFLILPLVAMSALAEPGVELLSMAPATYIPATARMPISVDLPDGISQRSDLRIEADATLHGARTTLYMKFSSLTALEEYLRHRYCGQIAAMSGDLELREIKGKARVSRSAKVTLVHYEGVDTAGEKHSGYSRCP